VGDAYERMFLNAARGDQSLFVSAAELVEAWRIFTPLLHQIDERRPQPVVHPFGVLPAGYAEWASVGGVAIRPTWQEYVATHGDQVDEMKKVFAELDANQSGTLSMSEVTELARRFFDGREPSEKLVKRIFQMFDADGDGMITCDELVAGAQKMHRSFAQSAEEQEDDLTSITSRQTFEEKSSGRQEDAPVSVA